MRKEEMGSSQGRGTIPSSPQEATREALGRLDPVAVEAAAIAWTESQKRDWGEMTDSQQHRRIRSMYVAIRAYFEALP